MSTTQELIDWLKKPLGQYEGNATIHGRVLDREECDSVVIRFETSEKMYVALRSLSNNPLVTVCGNSRSLIRESIKEWEGLK
jgi:hypothetical protein